MIDTTIAPGRNGREASVRQRYSAAAKARENALCCPVSYRREYLDTIPQEILERDYGCGDPTPYIREGDTVLDLGAGGGKVCYILSQVVGPAGRVIGVDCNQEMLTLARRHREEVARRIGYSNVEFRSLTVVAQKGKQGPCLERNQAVIYRGPFKKVEDDDDHVYYRGERMAVCDKTFRLLQQEPYAGRFHFIEPRDSVPLEKASRFDCSRPDQPSVGARRHPRETKGQDYDATTESAGTCTEGGNCC